MQKPLVINKSVRFDLKMEERITEICKVLGISYSDYVRFACYHTIKSTNVEDVPVIMEYMNNVWKGGSL